VTTATSRSTEAPATTTIAVTTPKGSTYYITQIENKVVYKCKSANNSCVVWLDLAGVSSLIPSMSAFNPNAIHLDLEADGTSRGLLVGTLGGDLIYCDMTPSACELITSDVGGFRGLGSAWDSQHLVTKFFFTTSSGGGVVNADGSGSVIHPSTWSLTDGGFFLVTPDSSTSDIIACTKRSRVERCPYVVDGKVSDCITLVSGRCIGVAPEYSAAGDLQGFVAVIGNQVQSCDLWGTTCQVVDGNADGNAGSDLASLHNAKSITVERDGTRGVSMAYWIVDAGNKRVTRCPVSGACEAYADFQGQSIAVESWATQEEVYPVADFVETANIFAKLEVVIDVVTKAEDALSPATKSWFGVEDIFNELTGTQGWTLDNVTKLTTNNSLRPSNDVATFALGFRLRYVAGIQTIPAVETMFDGVVANFRESVNEEVTGGNWTIITQTYAALEDQDAKIVVATSEETTTTKGQWEYDSSPCRSATLALCAALSFWLFPFVF